MLLLSGFAAIGVVLAVIGIYGVVANSVAQRRREIAIRMAVGAILVTRLGLFATLAGIAMGSAIVLSLNRLFASMLYGVTALDPMMYAMSAVSLMVIAMAAGLTPAAGILRFNIQEILRQ